MKSFLIFLYTIYFSILMIVPCNHTDSCTHLLEDLLGMSLHSHHHHHNHSHPHSHSHSHHHSDDQSDDSHKNNLHHHACVHVVMSTPPIGHCFFVRTNTSFYSSFIATQTKIWASPNEFGCLMFSDIWHPPKFLSC